MSSFPEAENQGMFFMRTAAIIGMSGETVPLSYLQIFIYGSAWHQVLAILYLL